MLTCILERQLFYLSFYEWMTSRTTPADSFIICAAMPKAVRFDILCEITNLFVTAVVTFGVTDHAALGIIRLGIDDMHAVNILSPFFFTDDSVRIISLQRISHNICIVAMYPIFPFLVAASADIL